MIIPVRADIVALAKGLIASLQPFAEANDIALTFSSQYKELLLMYRPEEIIPDLTQLLCRVITFTPQGYQVNVKIGTTAIQDPHVLFLIENTGVNLALLGDILLGITHASLVKGGAHCTNFCLKLPILIETQVPLLTNPISRKKTIIKPWYSQIRKRLTSHFSDPKHLEQAAKIKNASEGIFLQKINAIIYRNIDKEGFNSENLAGLVALSRTQLFRKIKGNTKMAPGQYIRFIRLQKAKELLGKGGLNVSEVAYRVGFISNSHFTRAFHKQFGLNPSDIKHG